MDLVSNDNVNVGAQSEIALQLDQDKHIAAYENTRFGITAVGDEKKGDVTIDLIEGKGLFRLEQKLTEDSSFIVKTPNATLSVRGTTFTASYDSETGVTLLEVDEGVVHVDTAIGPATDDVTAGQSRVIRNSEITAIASIDKYTAEAAAAAVTATAETTVTTTMTTTTAETTTTPENITAEETTTVLESTTALETTETTTPPVTTTAPETTTKATTAATTKKSNAKKYKIEDEEYSTDEIALHIFGKGLSDEDIVVLKNYTNLVYLNISTNNIYDLTPLKGLTKITKLVAVTNHISDLSPIKDLKKLEFLDISNNNISDITTLCGLTNLKYLKLSDNPISIRDIETLKKTLPNCEIIYDNY